jgi:hypothetical protein
MATSGSDWIAAFDEDGNCAGANEIVVDQGTGYMNLVIYGDDSTTPGVDEGINTGEAFSLVIWDASDDAFYQYNESFYGWINNNGAPMPGFNDPYFAYNFMSVVVHDLPLNSNWNLVCVNVMLDESGPATVFSEIIDDNNLVYVTGFGSGGATFFDPSGPGFLNTLTSIDPGMGYWVKVNSDDMLSTVGMPMADDYSMDLGSGWNLLAYWLENSMAPSDAFASLIADGNLVYVTGFGEAGATFFDPSGPSFLNTLTALESGMGY